MTSFELIHTSVIKQRAHYVIDFTKHRASIIACAIIMQIYPSAQ